jgi:hypothetical protein
MVTIRTYCVLKCSVELGLGRYKHDDDATLLGHEASYFVATYGLCVY